MNVLFSIIFALFMLLLLVWAGAGITQYILEERAKAKRIREAWRRFRNMEDEQ